MKKFITLAGAAAVSGLALVSTARAEEAREFTYSFNIGAVSDYMFRGFSQRDDKPAIQGGIDIGYGIWYAGVWGSNVAEGFVATNTEIDVYTGIKPVLGPVTFDFGVIYYGYPSQNSAIAVNFITQQEVNVDYWEFKAGASMSPIKDLTATVNYFYSPDYSYEAGPSHTIEGTLAYALPAVGVFSPTISGTIGHQSFDEAITAENGPGGVALTGAVVEDITYWNVGLALAVEKITFDMRYWGSNKDVDIPNSTSTDDRFVFGVKVALP